MPWTSTVGFLPFYMHAIDIAAGGYILMFFRLLFRSADNESLYRHVTLQPFVIIRKVIPM